MDRLGSETARAGLAARLADLRGVGDGEPSVRLAFNLAEIECEFHRFLDERVPELADPANRGESLDGTMVEVMLDLQHILDHVLDSSYLFDLLEPVLSEKIANVKGATR